MNLAGEQGDPGSIPQKEFFFYLNSVHTGNETNGKEQEQLEPGLARGLRRGF